MKTTITGTTVKDPVCGMTIDADKAVGTIAYEGETYFFCSPACREKFAANPAQFVSSTNETAKIYAPVSSEDVSSGRRNDHSTVSGAGDDSE